MTRSNCAKAKALRAANTKGLRKEIFDVRNSSLSDASRQYLPSNFFSSTETRFPALEQTARKARTVSKPGETRSQDIKGGAQKCRATL